MKSVPAANDTIPPNQYTVQCMGCLWPPPCGERFGEGCCPMPKTVLIAANDPHIAYLLQRYARQCGLEPVQTGSATMLPRLARTTRPALIILELDSLPGSHEALKRLSSNARTRGIPVVVYSALDQEPGGPMLHATGHLSAAVLYDDFCATLRQVGVQP